MAIRLKNYNNVTTCAFIETTAALERERDRDRDRDRKSNMQYRLSRDMIY